jgi:hypothetical protein
MLDELLCSAVLCKACQHYLHSFHNNSVLVLAAQRLSSSKLTGVAHSGCFKRLRMQSRQEVPPQLAAVQSSPLAIG